MKKTTTLTVFTSMMILLSGCQLGYIMKSGVGQMKLMNARVPIDKALSDPHIDDAKKAKLRLALEAREFAEKELHLKPTKNYTSYVELGRPYVTYVVSAAEKWQLKTYQWSYPFMGKMPYKGYFNEPDAVEEEKVMAAQDLDTYMRGVSAYSTLGWFNDPILSSMLRYDDYDLVNTIIHETVHATLYIKHEADFNERLATFTGGKGAELFYLKKEGPQSGTLKTIREESEDNKLFSVFISAELESLKKWYEQLPPAERAEEKRMARIQEIQARFSKDLKPKLKTKNLDHFPELKLNNARLLLYKTYMQDLGDFQKLYDLAGQNFSEFINRCKSLESADDPAAELKKLISDTTATSSPHPVL